MSKKAGLPAEDQFDPFARREAAASAFLPKPPPKGSDQQESKTPVASNIASNTDSIGVEEEEESVSTATKEAADLAAAPPPPSREAVGRTQMNARVLVDRYRALKKYQNRHGATFQAVVDQMVEEYLDRRGLLPKDKG